MTLREALKVVIDEESLGDFIYDVRSRAGEMGDGFKGNTWDHPRVTRFNDAYNVLRDELRRLEKESE